MEDLFNMPTDQTLDFLNDKKQGADGIYRIDVKKAKDPKKGYQAKLRLLPNLKDDGTLGPSAIEKRMSYVQVDEVDLKGYYDSPKPFGEKDLLSDTYWLMKKHSDPLMQERANMINTTTRYYCYALILEDENQPETVGKIFVWSFGRKIWEKIKDMNDGVVTGSRANVFDLANGHDLKLVVKQQGEWPSYDGCFFDQNPSPVKITRDGVLKAVPLTTTEDGRTVIEPKAQPLVKEFLLKRESNLSEYEPKPLTDEMRAKIQKIVAIVTNKDYIGSQNQINDSSTSFSMGLDNVATPASTPNPVNEKAKTQSLDSFFAD